MLADVSHEVAPQDTFKEIFVAKQGIKEVPPKPTSLVYCSDEALQKEADVTGGYRH